MVGIQREQHARGKVRRAATPATARPTDEDAAIFQGRLLCGRQREEVRQPFATADRVFEHGAEFAPR